MKKEKVDSQEKVDVQDPITDEPNWKDLYIRLYADTENLKKRVLKEKEDIKIFTKSKMIESILDMDSDLQIALKSFSEIPDGINLIVSKLKKFLEKEGIQEIPTEKYDSDIHEVISVIGNGNQIIDVVSKGYKIGERVIRSPKVILGNV